MPYATKEAHNKHCKEYYHTHNLKDKQTQRAKKNRWIKKYLKLINEDFLDKEDYNLIKTLSPEQLKTKVIELRKSLNGSYRLQNANNDISKEV